MRTLYFNPASIVTVDTFSKNVKSGRSQNELSPLYGKSLLCKDGLLVEIMDNAEAAECEVDRTYDLSGKTVLPGLVDCHTHTVFAGSRADEFREKIAGVDYEDIARRGGGILSTVNSVRKSTVEELVEIASERVEYFISQGITTLEIKSGYGLSFEDEVKLLKAVKILKDKFPIDIVSTFLGAHTFPPEFKDNRADYLDLIINKMLPYIAENNLAEYCDAFCEATAFTADEVDKIFSVASNLGFKLKLHSEQFNQVGGIDVAVKHKCTSVDHLEVFTQDQINLLKGNNIVSVLLPGVSFFLNYGYAPARTLIENDIPVALSTDYNPGSSHIANLNLVMSLAALKMKMTVEETISAVTINAAKAISREQSAGSIEVGKNADFAVFNTDNYSDIVYNVAKNLNIMTVKNGEVIYQK
ncbi:MAG: imidazolonepropionase [Melioribacteraceae bacterium]|nr:MAG: imidazolonepropionase [Melioribacteraceae bacterium]